uniref:Teneurin-1-4-like galactose-binding domain-containing protein n=1 Tax=Eptatretus burgeri TaxID=7764 RepID=A0A8C4NLU0_EPTBU
MARRVSWKCRCLHLDVTTLLLAMDDMVSRGHCLDHQLQDTRFHQARCTHHPPRPLPRSLPRNSGTFKAPVGGCSWRCTALVATSIASILTLLLLYFIVLHVCGLDWQFKTLEYQPSHHGPRLPTSTPDSSGNGRRKTQQPTDEWSSTVVSLGTSLSTELPPGQFWHLQLTLSRAQYLKFNVSLGRNAILGLYAR